jgi:hypothetical protein
VQWSRLNSSVSGQDLITNFCEHGDEPSRSIKYGISSSTM